jgi:hypothetical protein
MADVSFEVFVTPAQNKPGIEGIVEAQNLLIDKCVGEGFDYLFLVQADVEVPEDSYRNLAGLGVDVAQGVVPRHDDREALIAGFMDEAKKVWYLPRSVVAGQILSGWVFAGLSCTLIKRRVLEAGIRFKFQPGIGEDILFMFDVQSRGFVAKVHGGVLCGHLPEWPLGSVPNFMSPAFGVLDVGCGHRAQGDVNVDLFPEASAHRAADQLVNDDVALHVYEIPNFVVADALHLPFRDGAFRRVYSWHLIEHLENPNGFLEECCRIAAEEIEVRCPNGDPGWAYGVAAYGASKPLHVSRMTRERFERELKAFPEWDWNVRFDFSQSEPWEIVVLGVRRVYAA